MLLSALFMLSLGVIATFAPEILSGNAPPNALSTLTVQAAGALYLGFAILNWMAKDNAIGGIYSRPVAMGNLLHFFAMAMTLLRVLSAGDRRPAVLAVTSLYIIFTVGFGMVLFGRSPVSPAK